MKTILTTLFLTICIMVEGQEKKPIKDTSEVKWGTLLYTYPDYSNLESHDSLAKKNRFLFVSVIDDFSKYQHNIYDTVPVVMLVSDTSDKSNITFVQNEPDSSIVKFMDGNIWFRTSTKANSFEALSTITFYPVVIFGYQVIERYYTGQSVNALNYIGESKTTYLNHLKHPLPTRLMVWMAGRRN